MYHGSCLCGTIHYELLSEPRAATHCHCRMCQKQHGAAFATYASVPRTDLRYTRGEDKLTAYNSSGSILRKFCAVCGSSLEWSGGEQYPDWACIAVATLDTPWQPARIREVHAEARACWLDILPERHHA